MDLTVTAEWPHTGTGECAVWSGEWPGGRPSNGSAIANTDEAIRGAAIPDLKLEYGLAYTQTHTARTATCRQPSMLSLLVTFALLLALLYNPNTHLHSDVGGRQRCRRQQSVAAGRRRHALTDGGAHGGARRRTHQRGEDVLRGSW